MFIIGVNKLMCLNWHGVENEGSEIINKDNKHSSVCMSLSMLESLCEAAVVKFVGHLLDSFTAWQIYYKSKLMIIYNFILSFTF